jgi:hypothetical protein
MLNKNVINAVAALGVILSQVGSAHASCTGLKDPTFSTCGNGVVGGQMTNGFNLQVDLATGAHADGHSFKADTTEIFTCFVQDTIPGLGNRSGTATFHCTTTAAKVQVKVF